MRKHPTKTEALQHVQAMMIGLQRTRSIAAEGGYDGVMRLTQPLVSGDNANALMRILDNITSGQIDLDPMTYRNLLHVMAKSPTVAFAAELYQENPHLSIPFPEDIPLMVRWPEEET
jgi:hypothetical protein